MAEVLREYEDAFSAPDGRGFRVRVCGRVRGDRLWEAWIEFESVDDATVFRTGRETTQPSREMLRYWVGGLTWAYIDGALLRTLRPGRQPVPRQSTVSKPTFDGPAEPASRLAHTGSAAATAASPASASAPPSAVLDPYAVYAEGDEVLRKQLNALPAEQLRNIIRAYRLDGDAGLDTLSKARLIARIVTAVRQRHG